MNAQHTQGQLRAGPNGGYGLGPVNAIFIAESEVCGELIARLDTNPPNPNVEADARRLVACWNACEGIDTEHLERHGLPAFAKTISDLREQRDDLLAVLEKFPGFLAGVGDGDRWLEMTRAAIAKATRNET
jgi:hypothetical protein